MSHSVEFDWSIFVLIGFLLFAAIFIMIKLTIGSCYQPTNLNEKKKLL